MVADEENAATAAPVPPPVVNPAVVVAGGGGGTGPKLNKDGTERKKREPKKAKQPNPASNAQHNKQQPTKEQLDAQRNAMRETLKQLKEKRVLLGEEGEGEEGAFEIESVYDLALGLELWLRDNSKVFPEKPLKQKLDRMLQIQKQCIEQFNSDKLDTESIFWELASLYVIVNREAARPELNIKRPRFTMTAPIENFKEDPNLDKKQNEAKKRAMYLPAVGDDDEVSKEEVQRMLEEVEREVEKKINEMMDGGGEGGDGDEEGGDKGGTGATTSVETGAVEPAAAGTEQQQQQEQQQEQQQPKVEDGGAGGGGAAAAGGGGDAEMTDAPEAAAAAP